jgi:tRNA modification GTPase
MPGLSPSIETIAAVATAAAAGAIGIVRVSGPACHRVAKALCGQDLKPRQATLVPFLNEQGQPIDQGLAIFFKGPHSYTGEDVLELQGHGGMAVLQLVLRACLACHRPDSPVRAAQPGEFTQRAFLNDKMDLAQAQAVSDLIAAQSTRAAQAALASLTGAFSREIEVLQAQLIDLRLRVEACLDFPEEDIEFIGREHVAERLQACRDRLMSIFRSAQRGQALREGLRVALVGPPNVGKSSLLNALAEEEVAIVTSVPGTTRDRLVQDLVIEGLPIRVIDTAGLRQTDDEVERIGIERSWQAIEQADLVVLLRDASGQYPSDEAMEKAVCDRVANRDTQTGLAQRIAEVLVVFNKVDQCVAMPDTTLTPGGAKALLVSAKTGAGLDELRAVFAHAAGWSQSGSQEGVFSARSRQLEALSRADQALGLAAGHLKLQALELLAEQLRLAQQHLSDITGEYLADDLLGAIFGQFCIGK